MVIHLSVDPIDPGGLLADFTRGRVDSGAVVSFTGLVRADGGVEALELEAYPGFTEPAITVIADEAATRFALDDTLIVHRIGRVRVGEAVVFVATAAGHRRSAFEAADFLMDYLKSRAPFWKKSYEASGARWIEPSVADRADVARWDVKESS